MSWFAEHMIWTWFIVTILSAPIYYLNIIIWIIVYGRFAYWYSMTINMSPLWCIVGVCIPISLPIVRYLKKNGKRPNEFYTLSPF